jgi:hypothetical protein
VKKFPPPRKTLSSEDYPAKNNPGREFFTNPFTQFPTAQTEPAVQKHFYEEYPKRYKILKF